MIFTRTYDLLTWLLPLTHRFPKAERFVTTARLQNAVLNFQERLFEANAVKGQMRKDYLHLADSELDKVRVYIRLAHHWGWISTGQFEHVSKMILEIGKMLGGWIKQVGTEVAGATPSNP